jgi:hypothetical protein
MARTLMAALPSALNPGGDAVRACHAVAHHREDGETERHVDLLNLAVAEFRIECPAHDLLGTLGLGRGDREADRMLRASL